MANESVILRNKGEGTPIWWLGHPVTFLAGGAETSTAYSISVESIAPGTASKPLRHSFTVAFYLVEGELVFKAGNKELLLRKGDFIHVAPNTAHELRNVTSFPAEVLTLSIPAVLDLFQLEAGLPMESADQIFDSPSEHDLERLDAAAPKYGVDLNPPGDAFDTEPRLHVTRAGEGPAIDIVGDRCTFLVTGKETANTYAIWHALVTPGGGPPRHVHHREAEAFYVLEGELTFFANGIERTLTAGGFVHLPRDVPHTFKNRSAKEARTLILVAPAGIEKMFTEAGQPVTDRNSSPFAVTHAQIERLLAIAPSYGIEIFLPGT